MHHSTTGNFYLIIHAFEYCNTTVVKKSIKYVMVGFRLSTKGFFKSTNLHCLISRMQSASVA